MTLAAAVFLGAFTWFLLRGSLSGRASRAEGRARGLRWTCPLGWHSLWHATGRPDTGPGGFQGWLSQAGAAVTPTQFWAVSAGVGLTTFVLLMAVSRTPVVAALPALGAAAAPYGYWSVQRRKQAVARSAAWPDGLRYLVGVLGAGISTLHDALADLAQSGPEPLRAPMSRYVRMSARVGDRQALEAVRSELSDPVSDPVLLAFGGAVEEGTETVLRILRDLSSQITADIQLAEKIHTLQTESRAATWGCFAVPYAVLVFLCAGNEAYRQFFSRPGGLAIVLLGSAMSVIGLLASRRLVRPVATTERVFAADGGAWVQ